MREYERQIAHDRKLREFMKLKSQERQEDEELLTYRKRKGQINYNLPMSHSVYVCRS